MKGILPRYIAKQFLNLFLFTLIGAAILFVVMDVVENLDQFIDAKAPFTAVLVYYLYSLPYFMVLAMPFATMLAGVFSAGNLAKNNEIVAMKALGYSFYQLIGTLATMGLLISIASFLLAETIAIPANRKKGEIRRTYVEKARRNLYERYRNLLIQDPPDKIVSIEVFHPAEKTAYTVEIQTFRNHRLIQRLDAEKMTWNGSGWIIQKGVRRIFSGEHEFVFPVNDSLVTGFQFTPRELSTAMIKPDEMEFMELVEFIRRIRQSNGEANRWLTDLHTRIAFPLSNVLVILISVPLAYNRRKKSLVIGFAVTLFACFLFFGCVVLGQTLGHNRTMHPFLAAWFGNLAAAAAGLLNFRYVRK
jgi:lipopolysaccharide export system permease protein